MSSSQNKKYSQSPGSTESSDNKSTSRQSQQIQRNAEPNSGFLNGNSYFKGDMTTLPTNQVIEMKNQIANLTYKVEILENYEKSFPELKKRNEELKQTCNELNNEVWKLQQENHELDNQVNILRERNENYRLALNQVSSPNIGPGTQATLLSGQFAANENSSFSFEKQKFYAYHIEQTVQFNNLVKANEILQKENRQLLQQLNQYSHTLIPTLEFRIREQDKHIGLLNAALDAAELAIQNEESAAVQETIEEITTTTKIGADLTNKKNSEKSVDEHLRIPGYQGIYNDFNEDLSSAQPPIGRQLVPRTPISSPIPPSNISAPHYGFINNNNLNSDDETISAKRTDSFKTSKQTFRGKLVQTDTSFPDSGVKLTSNVGCVTDMFSGTFMTDADLEEMKENIRDNEKQLQRRNQRNLPPSVSQSDAWTMCDREAIQQAPSPTSSVFNFTKPKPALQKNRNMGINVKPAMRDAFVIAETREEKPNIEDPIAPIQKQPNKIATSPKRLKSTANDPIESENYSETTWTEIHKLSGEDVQEEHNRHQDARQRQEDINRDQEEIEEWFKSAESSFIMSHQSFIQNLFYYYRHDKTEFINCIIKLLAREVKSVALNVTPEQATISLDTDALFRPHSTSIGVSEDIVDVTILPYYYTFSTGTQVKPTTRNFSALTERTLRQPVEVGIMTGLHESVDRAVNTLRSELAFLNKSTGTQRTGEDRAVDRLFDALQSRAAGDNLASWLLQQTRAVNTDEAWLETQLDQLIQTRLQERIEAYKAKELERKSWLAATSVQFVPHTSHKACSFGRTLQEMERDAHHVHIKEIDDPVSYEEWEMLYKLEGDRIVDAVETFHTKRQGFERTQLQVACTDASHTGLADTGGIKSSAGDLIGANRGASTSVYIENLNESSVFKPTSRFSSRQSSRSSSHHCRNVSAHSHRDMEHLLKSIPRPPSSSRRTAAHHVFETTASSQQHFQQEESYFQRSSSATSTQRTRMHTNASRATEGGTSTGIRQTAGSESSAAAAALNRSLSQEGQHYRGDQQGGGMTSVAYLDDDGSASCSSENILSEDTQHRTQPPQLHPQIDSGSVQVVTLQCDSPDASTRKSCTLPPGFRSQDSESLEAEKKSRITTTKMVKIAAESGRYEDSLTSSLRGTSCIDRVLDQHENLQRSSTFSRTQTMDLLGQQETGSNYSGSGYQIIDEYFSTEFIEIFYCLFTTNTTGSEGDVKTGLDWLNDPSKSGKIAFLKKELFECVSKTNGHKMIRVFFEQLLSSETSTEIMSYFLNMQDEIGNTLLHLAISRSNWNLVNFILKLPSIDLNVFNKAGYIPLMLTALSQISTDDELAVVRLLILRCQEQFLAVNPLGGSVLDLLPTNGKKTTLLFLACEHGNASLVHLLLLCEANPNLADADGNTPLMTACVHGHHSIVNLLLALPLIEIEARNKNGSSAAALSRENNQADILRLFNLKSLFGEPKNT